MRYILSIQLQSKGGHCQFNLTPTFLILAELGILNGNSGGGGIPEVWVRAFKVSLSNYAEQLFLKCFSDLTASNKKNKWIKKTIVLKCGDKTNFRHW